MKIGFYLDNNGLRDVDLSNPKNGNPGIGGTQFMIWQLAYYLQKAREELEVYIYANRIENLYSLTKNYEAKDLKDAIMLASSHSIDIFVFRSITDASVYELIDANRLNSVAWGHNFGDSKQLELMKNCSYLKKYVCVGKEQLAMLRDHKIFDKATYIYNFLDFDVYKAIKGNNKKDNIVCYIGSIIPEKGFHILAEVWPDIVKSVPDAKLYVIGSGKLYDRDSQLGKYNIASSSYEKQFINYLTDGDDNISDNIKFFGVLSGTEKLDIMSKAKVGVVNPSARTETFGIGAIEFQALGIPVVSKGKNGHIDTIYNMKEKNLCSNKKQLAAQIIKLLKQEKNEYGDLCNCCKEFVYNNFGVDKVLGKWIELFEEIFYNKNTSREYKVGSYVDNHKWLFEFNRKIKSIPIFKSLPSIIEYRDYIKKLKSKNA
ncbi:glycosyltransferase family 4 protein [Clostridium sp. C8-1-8]|uniref:glycosyltransferase family 4 protein n=1 Tax=Clostridium sp. C8-1-8 TaxID=2698831 RepID=UPI0013697C66|nr:glycosyltransferase family 4 protein [Clostridium sp. C8-1-8]